jgi:Zn-finger nucleic acid-binding protein
MIAMRPSKLLSPCFPAAESVYLNTITINGVELDICPKTGGIWFDRFEIKKFDESHEDLTDLLSALPKKIESPKITQGRQSPKHPGVIMQQRPYGPKATQGILTVDICPVCNGTWLDHSEIEKIRQLYPSDADREKCIQAFVNNSFGFNAKEEEHSALGMSRLILKLSQKI